MNHSLVHLVEQWSIFWHWKKNTHWTPQPIIECEMKQLSWDLVSNLECMIAMHHYNSIITIINITVRNMTTIRVVDHDRYHHHYRRLHHHDDPDMYLFIIHHDFYDCSNHPRLAKLFGYVGHCRTMWVTRVWVQIGHAKNWMVTTCHY